VLLNNKNFTKVEIWLAVIWQSSAQTKDLELLKGVNAARRTVVEEKSLQINHTTGSMPG
jgi:hypothetical protein